MKLYRSKIPTNPTPLRLSYRISNGIREVIPTAHLFLEHFFEQHSWLAVHRLFLTLHMHMLQVCRAAIAPISASLAEDGASGGGGRAGGRGRGRARTGITGDHDASSGGRIVRVVCLVNDSRGVDRPLERVSASWFARGINPLPIEGVAVNVGPVREFLL